jgi:hypothetical protein
MFNSSSNICIVITIITYLSISVCAFTICSIFDPRRIILRHYLGTSARTTEIVTSMRLFPRIVLHACFLDLPLAMYLKFHN